MTSSFHLFAADHPLDVTRHYYDVTGCPRLPARWALGPFVWRDEIDSQSRIESDLWAMRDLDLAATAIWIDGPQHNPWASQGPLDWYDHAFNRSTAWPQGSLRDGE